MKQVKLSNVKDISLDFLPIKILLCSSTSSLQKLVKQLVGEELHASNLGSAWLLSPEGSQAHIVLHIDKQELMKLPVAERVNICAHEAVHVVQMIHSIIEEEETGKEMEAYLIGHFSECAFNTVKGVTSGNSKAS